MSSARRSFAFRLSLALATTALSVTAPAWADLPRSDTAAGERADALMKQVAPGSLDDTFRAIAGLGRPEDSGFPDRLARQREIAQAQAKTLGALRSVRFIEQSHFVEACIERDYRVSYAGGQQSWRFKFRHGAHGWYLYDLYIV